MTPFEWLLAAAATARLTRLVTLDDVPPLPAARRWLAQRLDVAAAYDRGDPPSSWWTLVTCAWCISFWIGAAVVAVGYATGPNGWWSAICGTLAVSLVAGVVDVWTQR